MPSFTSLLVILCSVMTPILCCNFTKHFGDLNGKTLDFINQMGGPMTDQNSPVSFPDKLYESVRNAEVESQLVFIRDSLKLISDLYYHHNLTSVTWDIQHLRDFRQTIHKQVDRLNTCVSGSRKIDRRLRNYYRRLTRCTLGHTGGSAASWELIRKVTKQHLVELDVMMNLIKASKH